MHKTVLGHQHFALHTITVTRHLTHMQSTYYVITGVDIQIILFVEYSSELADLKHNKLRIPTNRLYLVLATQEASKELLYLSKAATVGSQPLGL